MIVQIVHIHNTHFYLTSRPCIHSWVSSCCTQCRMTTPPLPFDLALHAHVCPCMHMLCSYACRFICIHIHTYNTYTCISMHTLHIHTHSYIHIPIETISCLHVSGLGRPSRARAWARHFCGACSRPGTSPRRISCCVIMFVVIICLCYASVFIGVLFCLNVRSSNAGYAQSPY